MSFFKEDLMFGKKERIVLIITAFIIGIILSTKGVLMKVIAGIIAGIAIYKFLKDNHII